MLKLPKAFWLLFLGQTLNRIGLLVPAFLVLYLEEGRLADPSSTPVVLGLFGAGVVSAGLVGGVIADIIGARRTIMGAQVACVLVSVAMIFSTNIYLIGLFALIGGFLSAVHRPAGAGLVAALVPQENFSRAYSMLHVGFNVGASLGPVLSGFLLAAYPPALFIAWSVSSLLYLLLMRAVPKDIAVPLRGGDQPWTVGRALRGVVEPFRNPVLFAYLLLSFLLACIYLQAGSALPLHMASVGLNPEQIGLVLAVNAVLMVGLLPFVPKLTARMGESAPMALGSLLVGLGFGLNALATNMSWFAVAVVIWTVGEVVYVPMAATFLARRAPARLTSTYQGSFFFAWNLGLIAGGPLGIVSAREFSYSALWLGTMVLGLLVAIGFALLPKLPGYSVLPAQVPAEDTAAA
ncbi:MFS transporter [Kutzneria viridogrisea]|uniref:MFS family permease n=1 Tax=Kutzneria viridogrisea TaxID=47990 RepID=A0ABR6BKT5_9PSEU|nr:MFS family permease [Kutzneria viridogrisea]